MSIPTIPGLHSPHLTQTNVSAKSSWQPYMQKAKHIAEQVAKIAVACFVFTVFPLYGRFFVLGVAIGLVQTQPTRSTIHHLKEGIKKNPWTTLIVTLLCRSIAFPTGCVLLGGWFSLYLQHEITEYKQAQRKHHS